VFLYRSSGEKGRQKTNLDVHIEHVWTELRDNVEDIKIEDPANPTGNDLSELFNASVRQELSSNARRALELIERLGWEAVFGQVPEKSSRASVVAGYTGRSTGSFGEG